MSSGVDSFKYLMSFPLIFASISTFHPPPESESELESDTVALSAAEDVALSAAPAPELTQTPQATKSADSNNQEHSAEQDAQQVAML